MKNKKVLIVDDNALNRKVFEHIIGQVYLFEVAENGRDAIEKIKTIDFDLLIMDIQMPVLDGINALRIIKEDQLFHKPIIAISAYADDSDRDYFLSTGFDDFIAKPVKPKLLLETIAHHLRKSSVTKKTVSAPLEDFELDRSILNQLMKYNSKENIMTVYEDFLEECIRLLAEIEILIRDENYPEIGEKLHIIKGNSGTLGAMKIFNFTKSFEKNIKTGNFDNTLKDYLYLKELVKTFKNHIQSPQTFDS